MVHQLKVMDNFRDLPASIPIIWFKQLSSFKEGVRKNGHMQAIAGTLSEDDMKALAAYFGSL